MNGTEETGIPSWEELERAVLNCRRCGLCTYRIRTVLGEGNRNADILLVGEGPGRDEDMLGRPFVGAAGKLLDRMLDAIELSREDVYIANVVKCRPPNNRVPEAEEAAACLPYLRCQYALIRPKIVVCMGATAAGYLYEHGTGISRVRGIWKEKKGVWFLPTYHPAALLRDESKKRYAWEDLQSLRSKYQELKQ